MRIRKEKYKRTITDIYGKQNSNYVQKCLSSRVVRESREILILELGN